MSYIDGLQNEYLKDTITIHWKDKYNQLSNLDTLPAMYDFHNYNLFDAYKRIEAVLKQEGLVK